MEKPKGPQSGAAKKLSELFTKLKKQQPSEELIKIIKEESDEFERQQNEEKQKLPKIARRERDSEI